MRVECRGSGVDTVQSETMQANNRPMVGHHTLHYRTQKILHTTTTLPTHIMTTVHSTAINSKVFYSLRYDVIVMSMHCL